MATKKLAKRILRRVNGRLTVVYVDVETGQVLQSLDGYTLTTHGETSPQKTETPPTPAPAEQVAPPRESNTPSPDDYSPEQHEINRNRPMGSGNILKDLPGAIEDLRGDIDGVKGGVLGALTNLGARLFGGTIGKGIGEDIGKGIKENGITGAGDAVRDLGTNISNTVGGIGDSIKGGIGGLFGNGDTAAATPQNGAYSPLQNPKGVNLNPQLEAVLNEAALRSPYSVVVKSGERPGDSRQHGRNNAVDINLVDPDTGEVIPDYQDGPAFRVYEQFAQTARTVQQNLYPEIDDDLRWGGYFTANGSPKGYGAADLMHFDLAGRTVGWGAGGNWATGAADVLRQAYPGLESKGMGNQKWALTPTGVSPVEEIRVAEEAKKVAPVPATRMADAAPVTPPKGVDPKLAEAVLQRKALSKQNIANPAPTAVAQAPVAAPVAPVEAAMAPTVPMSFNPAQTPVPRGFDYTLPAGQSTGNVNVAENALQQPMPQQQPMVTDVAQVPKQGFMERGLGGNDKVGGLDILGREESNHYLDSFLDTINYAEGSPKENSLFGYGEFDDYSTHPNKPVPYNDGADHSTAAGLFQINYATWAGDPTVGDPGYASKAGVKDFSPESQRAVARLIATDRYSRATGRDLAQDLMSGDRNLIEGAYSALKGTWSSLPGGSQEKSVMDDLVARFESGSAFKAPSTKDISGTRDRNSANTGAFAEPTTSFDSVTKTSAPSTFAQRPSDSAKNKPATQSTMSSSLGNRDSGGTIGASTFNKTGTSSNAQTAKTNQKTSNSSGGSFAPKPEVINNPKTNGSSGGFASPRVSNPDKTNQVTSSTKTDSKTSNSSKDKSSKTK